MNRFYKGARASVKRNEEMVAVTKPEEIMNAKKQGKVAGMLSIEGAEPLMGDIGLLRVFYRLGVRMLSFAWNFRTPFADGLGAKRSESKLPELGVQALEEMGNLGMVFDVSHLCDSNFWDVADVMDGPFIASHSNCRALSDHPRNLTDDMLKALAEKGGVTGMNYAPSFVVPRDKITEGYKPTVEDLVNHIDHIVDVVGINHVGLGSDFDGIGQPPADLEDVSKVPNITGVLVKRGYSDEDIKKILGGNHLRVFKQVIR